LSVLLLFVDGVGIGTRGIENPFAAIESRFLGVLAGADPPDGFSVAHTDATLGVPGLPQSATGQTALFTGENAAKLLDGHLWGFPNAALRALLKEKSIVRRMAEAGARVGFLNGFAGPYADPASRVLRSATTHAMLAAGARLRTFDEVASGAAVTFDLTGDVLRARGVPAPKRTIEEAGRALARSARDLDFAVFEYFLTDKAGHSRDMTWGREEVRRLDRLIGGIVEHMDAAKDLFVVTSDHGNLEDLAFRGHTDNPVATLAFGRGAPALAATATDLCALARALERAGGL